MLLFATHIGLPPIGPGVQQQPLHLYSISSKKQQSRSNDCPDQPERVLIVYFVTRNWLMGRRTLVASWNVLVFWTICVEVWQKTLKAVQTLGIGVTTNAISIAQLLQCSRARVPAVHQRNSRTAWQKINTSKRWWQLCTPRTYAHAVSEVQQQLHSGRSNTQVLSTHQPSTPN